MTVVDFRSDANKTRTNLAKHGVSFPLGTVGVPRVVFRDPLALTIFDEEHSDDEDRCVTLGQAQNGRVLVVVHTSDDVSSTELHIRIISARRADPAEVIDYAHRHRANGPG